MTANATQTDLPICQAEGCSNTADPRFSIHGKELEPIPACDAHGNPGCDLKPCTCPPHKPQESLPKVSDQRAQRVNFLGAPEFYNLNAACLLVTQAFSGISFGTFHVGSSITRRDYRDVDIRIIMPDEEFERMFAAKRGGWSNALWSLLCVSISAWLKERTGLPIDFQIQSMSEANGDYPKGERNALGLFVPRHQANMKATGEDHRPWEERGWSPNHAAEEMSKLFRRPL